MSLADAAAFITGHLDGAAHAAIAPAGHTTKVINGKSRSVTAAEAWVNSATNQADPVTVKLFLGALAEEFRKRGDGDRASASLKLSQTF